MWSVLLILKTALSYVLYGSVKTGQFIVSTSQLLLTNHIYLIKKLLNLLIVLIEDFTIFILDVVENIDNLTRGLTYLGECVAGGVMSSLTISVQLLQLIYNFISTLWTKGIDGIFLTINMIRNIFIFIKKVVIAFGDGVWFLIIYIPKSAISLISSTFFLIIDSCFQIFFSLSNKIHQFRKMIVNLAYDCYCFLTDVPVESLIGLIIAVCFIYIFFQFYATLLLYIRQKIFSFLNLSRLKYRHLKSVFSRFSLIRDKENNRRDYGAEGSIKLTADSYCVICQEHEKCILVLPCKHLCLCNNCTQRMMRYNRRCPICRKHINSTMRVFT